MIRKIPELRYKFLCDTPKITCTIRKRQLELWMDVKVEGQGHERKSIEVYPVGDLNSIPIHQLWRKDGLPNTYSVCL